MRNTIIVQEMFSKMKNKRLQYFVIVLIIIASEIISRKILIVPLFIGDLLYAVMMYFIFRMLFPKSLTIIVAIFSLTLCFLIECFQLYQVQWIIDIRKTSLGHLVLGEGFLWSDLVAYFFGTLIAFFLDRKVILIKKI